MKLTTTMGKSIANVLVALMLCLMLFPTAAFADDEEESSTINSNEDAATSIVNNEVDFGLSAVQRAQVGLNKTYDDIYWGYCFPLGKTASEHFCVVATETEIIVYVAPSLAEEAGFDLDDEYQQNIFIQMIEELDEELSDGGTKLSDLDLDYVFTSEDSYVQGDVTFTFDVEIEEGYYYVTCMIEGETDCGDAADFCLSGQVLPASEVYVPEENTWWEDAVEFFTEMDYRPLWVSLRTAGVAMIFIFVFGLLAAYKCMNVKGKWKSLLDSIFTIPMVLPPTVVGFILLVIFGNSSAFGRFLLNHGIKLIFSWPAAVMAAAVVGFPLMYRTALGAFESLDTNMLDAARTLGWSEWKIFIKLMLPLAWPSIASGTVLSFARAMGEFGATLFVAGNYAGKTQTMPIAIYFAWMGGQTDVAVFWVVVVILISFIVILIINVYSSHVQRYRRAGGKASKDVPIVEEDEVAFSLDEEAAAALGFGKPRKAAAEDAGGAAGGAAGAADAGNAAGGDASDNDAAALGDAAAADAGGRKGKERS